MRPRGVVFPKKIPFVRQLGQRLVPGASEIRVDRIVDDVFPHYRAVARPILP